MLCKSYVGFLPPAPPTWPPASPLPSSNEAPTAASTPRAPGSTYTYLPVTATLFMSPEACASVSKYPKPFSFQYSDATAAAWNNTQLAQTPPGTAFVLPGDVVVSEGFPKASCGASGRKLIQSMAASSSRKVLATGDQSSSAGTSSGPSVAMAASVNLPTGFTVAQATALQSQFASACVKSYTSGQFASNYAITGASVTVSSPQTAVYSVPSSSSSNTLAIGLGVGLGVGIPVLAGVAFAAYYLSSKKAAEKVAPSAEQ